ncbi:hypothetical protein SBRCBS47491_006663 [Sporothrix bragantina]|uniref:Ars-binding protein n=1 Tax=Sporothrix bragantina TaxID=671064 RepID=A0ABP0C6U2_9PEZI
MQQPASGLYVGQTAPTSAPTSMTHVGGMPPSVNGLGAVSAQQQSQSPTGAMLPNRTVTAATIEDAYVSFILACNPAVSPSTDTTALREAFRTPPRSDGKSFSIFTLYQLICQLEDREIKTWAELALKLGVEPPDQDKGQSSQKIQQYAVRLKRWMHSMHVNAFFDYLMDRPHPYWTNIPTGPYPVSEHLRDGVAAKDDMALRALIPEIKPRRGRRRPDDDDQEFFGGRSPPRRQRLDDYVDDLSAPESAAGRWSVHSDGSSEFGLSHRQHVQASDMTGVVQSHLQTPPPAWSAGLMNTPLSVYPQSAVTPSTRLNSWADEPRSAVTPSSSQPARKPGRRHGAKVVSSAWRSSGAGGSGKTRGRPPINRNGNHHTIPPASTQEAAFPPTSTVGRTTPTYPPVTSTYSSHMESTTSAPHASMSIQEVPPMSALAHLLRRHSHSLLLHKYDPAALELPLPMDFAPDPSGQHSQTPSLVDTHSPAGGTNIGSGTTGATSVTPEIVPDVAAGMDFEIMQKPGGDHNAPNAAPRPKPIYSVQFGAGAPGDRTNIDEIEAYFMTEVFAATWYDENDQRIPPCSVEEACALVDIVIEDLVKGASCREAFLINLAALAGGKILMSKAETRIKRLERTADYTKYDFSWELRFGDVCGQFSITEVVEHARWKTMATDVKASVARAVGLKTEAEERAEQPLPPKGTNPYSGGITASMDGGRMKFPMQGGTINAGGRYENFGPGTVPRVNPGLQNYTPDGSTDLNFGAPAGSQHSTGGGTTPNGSTANAADENAELAAIWEGKYRHLLQLLYKRDRQLDRTRYAVLQGIRKTYDDDNIRKV